MWEVITLFHLTKLIRLCIGDDKLYMFELYLFQGSGSSHRGFPSGALLEEGGHEINKWTSGSPRFSSF